MIQAQELIERALALRTVDESMVLVTDASEASLRWAGNSMTTNGVSTSRNWTVISIVRDAEGAHVGTVSSSTVDPQQIPDVVRASEEAARTAPPAEDAMDLIPGSDVTDPGWSEAAASTGIDVFGRLAGDLADGFDGADRLYGFAHHQLHSTWLGTSTGVRRRFTQPTGSVEINGKRGDASAWVGAGTADFTDVSVPSLLAQLATRLDWAKRTVDLPAGRYETLLPPSAVADLMIYLMWTMEGRGAEEGHTALSKAGGTRVGERLTDFPLTLRSDPMAPGLEYTPFVATTTSSDSLSLFDNGMGVDRVDWVRDGTVNALAYPRHAAREFGASVAVPGDNLLLTGAGAATIDDMVARTERGLLLTTLWYIREVDPATLLLTGLTRDGVYLVEDGEVAGAVNNFRFNESPLDLLRRVSEVGATETTLPREWKDWFTRTAMPPLRIPDFHMSSVSQAQ
ncbi:metallopeptidase TldD-related protein [Rhodococcus maanshanensis]|uniref:Predicted Zn-dependent protease or its inactivated homolog n=1 Tax=Rhodococcus maanshanensis TaxID=183556 RepID=A0A1H7LI82_9NOCA|nr:metallopeptidase TldD-related protein [Rhodococcus maanshanensis]SEK98616.1 Predicted Zn-dependent protease or its inactivated homolog [Rhodococcus maanshanensis]